MISLISNELEPLMSVDFSLVAVLVALVFGAAGLGGGVYETLLVDRVWPRNPAIIQPARGGLKRGLFWGLMHPPYELALLVSVWLTWSHPAVRPWTVVALVAHLVARVWSFAYFIPRALRFEKMGDLTDDQRRQAQRWIELSRVRPFIEVVAIIALGVAVATEAATR
jgi:hypothetical protein